MEPENIWKTWKGHAGFGCLAFDALPAWQKELFKPDMRPAALAKPYLPKEGILSPREKTGFLCSIMDLVYYDECRPYATFPDGRWIPHCPPDENRQAAGASGNSPSPVVSVEIIEMLMNKMIEAVRRDDWEEAIRHGGALGHFVQEPFTPGHCINADLLQQLFPDPDHSRHIRLHYAFDCGTTDFEPLAPILMGNSVPEAALRMQVEIDRGIRQAKTLAGSIIRLLYDQEHHPRAAREALLAGQSQAATWLTSCAWYTAICIAQGRFDKSELQTLQTIDLTRLVPYFWHHCDYTELLPGCLVKDSRKIPIHVFSKNTKGSPEEQLIVNGFGMGGHMGCKFFVNGDIYRRFHCQVGLPSRHAEGQSANTRTEFRVEIDRQLNKVYSEDLKYGGQVLTRVPLHPGREAQVIDVDITGARALMLVSECQPYRDRQGLLQWDIPHVAVCEPVLSKT
ncbi:MAG: hypothetical protein NT011_05420 [Kiritimatiellaeota bacterium]|nr:hypothetical protein [Kiritimatiellota bacterium]